MRYWMFGTSLGWIKEDARGSKKARFLDALAYSPSKMTTLYLFEGKKLIGVKDLTSYLKEYATNGGWDFESNGDVPPDLAVYYLIDKAVAGSRRSKWYKVSDKMEHEVLQLFNLEEKKHGKDDGSTSR